MHLTTAAALLLIAAVVVSAAEETVAKKKANVATDENFGKQGVLASDVDGMPDHRDPVQKKQLDCAACQSAAYEALLSLENLRQATPKEGYKNYMISSSLDDLCEKTKLHMGLLRDKEKKVMVMQYGNERHRPVVEKYGIVKGAWVTPLWLRQCHELVERIEDDVLDIYNGKMKDRPDYNVCPICPPPTEEEKKAHAERVAAEEKGAAEKAAADKAGEAKAEL
jgi:hypothetical protein